MASYLLQIVSSLVLLCTLCIYSVVSTKHNSIKGQKFLCGTHSPELVTLECRFKRVNRTTEFWSIDGHFSPDFSLLSKTDNFFINITAFTRQQNLQYRPQMIINFFVDICKYMDGSLTNKFLDFLASDLKKASNIMHPCPYSGNFYIRNMTFSDENFPSILPASEMYIDFQYYMYVNGSEKLLHYLRPYLEIKTKGIFYF